MARWPRGEAESSDYWVSGTFRRSPVRPPTESRCSPKQGTLETAASITSSDPDSALILAYDAARYATTALLAQQVCGQRQPAAMSRSTPPSVPSSATASAGFGYLRRRRNELEYPTAGTAASDVDEANDAVAQSRGIVQAAEKLLPNLGFFA